jgi:hypothetical protein
MVTREGCQCRSRKQAIQYILSKGGAQSVRNLSLVRKGIMAWLDVAYLHGVEYHVEFNCFLKTYIVVYLAGIRQGCQYSQRREQQQSAKDVRLL